MWGWGQEETFCVSTTPSARSVSLPRRAAASPRRAKSAWGALLARLEPGLNLRKVFSPGVMAALDF